ncbi:MAG: saccharopine dehydrogenase NADP-binding domain-containing protein [Leptospira sp.]|nr:saccharopine dehydrogenase NADP-binding domain-containing protein [Leptospira sp.]
MNKNAKYDIVIFGATGFTGELTAKYLAGKMQSESFTFGIAGRDITKLNSLKNSLIQINPNCTGVGVIIADVNDAKSLLQMAKDTKVLITTVGPYLKYGDPVVRACIEGGSDYLDLTGEGEFVENVQRLYGAKARENKVKIVNCCGFDSIPADLGTYFTVKKLHSDEPIEVECFVSFSSNNPSPLGQFYSVSGGTWHSAIGFMKTDELERQTRSCKLIASTATNHRIVGPIPVQFRMREQIYGAPLPFVDVEVVLRSAAALSDYGPDFKYGHYAAVSSTPKLLGGLLGAGALFALAQFEPTRNFLLNLRKPGEGPDREQRDSNSYILSFAGKCLSRKIKVEVRGGDPGYGDTSKMLGESALCLIHDRKELPEVYGVITPAVSMGEKLISRLDKVGITFREIK